MKKKNVPFLPFPRGLATGRSILLAKMFQRSYCFDCLCGGLAHAMRLSRILAKSLNLFVIGGKISKAPYV